MFEHLHISDRRERRLVAAADTALGLAFMPARALRAFRHPSDPRRILLMRLERIGDLLMTIPAVQAIRDLAPTATIDLVVGSWNEPIARLMPDVDRVETLDAAWLARESTVHTTAALARRGLEWRARRYDLAINFEPDIRSHLLMACSGARRRVGFDSGGGGPTLTTAIAFDPARHTIANAMALAAAAFGASERELSERFVRPLERGQLARVQVPDAPRAHAVERLHEAARPLVAVHVSGGRAIKQWPPDRFGEVAARLAAEFGATIVLTGVAQDRDLVDEARRKMPSSVRVIDLVGQLDLVALAAVLEQTSMLVTGDSGPMHLADAVRTPVVAVFGLSDPRRYGPLRGDSRVVRIDLPCSPCNRVRRPPERCIGHTPDCLRGVTIDQVVTAASELLRATASPRVA